MGADENEMSRRAMLQAGAGIALSTGAVTTAMAAQGSAAGRPIRSGQLHPFYDYSSIVKARS